MSSINCRPYTKEHEDKIHYYSPPVPVLPAYKTTPNTNIKIGLISGERLLQGFRYEAEVYLLTEENWKHVLKYIKLDFVLIESCLKSVTGHWVCSQIGGVEKNIKLEDVINYAANVNIPTVYWFTQDHLYHDKYNDLVRMFDYVFCADTREVDLLQQENIKAEVLLPAVQPALYNPLRDYKFYSDMEVGVLFDGWSDMFRNENILDLLHELKRYGLKIIDSKKQVFKDRLKDYQNYSDNILGCVSEDERRILLKYSKAVISFGDTMLTPTSQQWDALEVAATRVNVLHRGDIDDNDVRKNIVIENNADIDILSTLVSFQEDDLYRERLAHKAWREVNMKHTFNHRLKSICDRLKINVKDNAKHLASIIAPTFRSSNISEVIQTYKKQAYTNKELILVYNGAKVISNAIKDICNGSDDITLVTVPPENGVGVCMNIGHSMAKGDYCFRMDDDDIYAPNYILDMMLHLKSSDFDLFGCPPGYISFEGKDKVYKRNNKIHPLSVVPSKLVLQGSVYMGGNTIGGKTSFLIKNQYPESSFGAADTSFTLEACKHVPSVLLMDSFNMLIRRSADTSKHTWRLSYEDMKSNLNSQFINCLHDVVI